MHATMWLPASPRARRRLLRVAAGAAVLAVIGLLVALIPDRSPPNPAPAGTEGAAQIAASVPKVHLTRADRRAIDATLDRFIPAAVTRKDPAAAWALAGPELRSGSTLSQWRAGTSPIPYYPAAPAAHFAWRTIDVGRDYVVFNVLVQPRQGAKVSPYVFSGEVVRRHGRWLVNRLYTIAVMNRVTKTTHEIGPADFAAPPPSGTAPAGKSRLGGLGIVPVLAILGLVLLVPLVLGVAAIARRRRFRRGVAARNAARALSQR